MALAVGWQRITRLVKRFPAPPCWVIDRARELARRTPAQGDGLGRVAHRCQVQICPLRPCPPPKCHVVIRKPCTLGCIPPHLLSRSRDWSMHNSASHARKRAAAASEPRWQGRDMQQKPPGYRRRMATRRRLNPVTRSTSSGDLSSFLRESHAESDPTQQHGHKNAAPFPRSDTAPALSPACLWTR